MSQTTFDILGKIKLAQITAVIQALFGSVMLDAKISENGLIEIGDLDGEADTSWDSMTEDLRELAESLSLATSDENGKSVVLDDASTEEILWALAGHFGCAENEQLAGFIEHEDFEDNIDISTRFFLATLFDDGHGLEFYETEGAWTDSKPSFGDFGGLGAYESKRVYITGTSTEACTLGEQMDAALKENNGAACALAVKNRVSNILEGIADQTLRQQVREELVKQLMS